MEIKSLTHNFLIIPTVGFDINDVRFDADTDGSVCVYVTENISAVDGNTTQDEKDELIKSLQSQVNELSGIRVKEKEYKLRINSLTQIWKDIEQQKNKLEQENIILKADANRGQTILPELLKTPKKPKGLKGLRNKACACGCGKIFLPTGKNQKYAVDCPNLPEILKKADLKRQNKHRGKEGKPKAEELKDGNQIEPEKQEEFIEIRIASSDIGCETCTEQEEWCSKHDAKCSLSDPVPYRHYKPKL